MGRRRSRAKIAGPFEANIDALAHDGRGIGRLEADAGTESDIGKAVFIADALPGERVRYMRTRLLADFADGRLEEVLTAAPERVEPPCQYAGYCAGCTLQHMDHAAQVSAKQDQFATALQRQAKSEPESWLPPIVGPALGYRRKARLSCKYVPGKGGVLVGFRERDKPYVADIAACKVLIPEVGEQLNVIGEMLSQLSVRAAVPQVEVGAGDDEIALALRVLQPVTDSDRAIMAQFERETGFVLYLQPGNADSIAPLTRPARLHYGLPEYDVRVEFQPLDFVQVNAAVNTQIIARAIDLMQLDEHPRVLELFAGLGNFSLPIARSGGQVTTAEGEAGLVARAQTNAASNGLAEHITAHVADLFEPGEQQANWTWAQGQYDVALLDPPRAGAKECLPALVATGVRRIVYVSCHPATLARDVHALVHEHGFVLEAASVADMFPMTGHVESVVALRKEAGHG